MFSRKNITSSYSASMFAIESTPTGNPLFDVLLIIGVGLTSMKGKL